MCAHQLQEQQHQLLTRGAGQVDRRLLLLLLLLLL
jgi:hypothetical protein